MKSEQDDTHKARCSGADGKNATYYFTIIIIIISSDASKWRRETWEGNASLYGALSTSTHAKQFSCQKNQAARGFHEHFLPFPPPKGQTYAPSGTFPSITFKITICQNIFINLETCPICPGIIGYSDMYDNKVPNKPGPRVTHGLSLCT